MQGNTKRHGRIGRKLETESPCKQGVTAAEAEAKEKEGNTGYGKVNGYNVPEVVEHALMEAVGKRCAHGLMKHLLASECVTCRRSEGAEAGH